MQVFVYPQIRCRRALVPVPGPHLGWRTRWFLLPPTELVPEVTPLPEGPQPEVGPIAHPEAPPPDEKGVYTIEAALWKQSDGYFKGDRYDPATITDYNKTESEHKVDGQYVREDESGKFYCSPSDTSPGGPATCALPEFESERIDVIVLKPAEVNGPTQEFPVAEGPVASADLREGGKK